MSVPPSIVMRRAARLAQFRRAGVPNPIEAVLAEERGEWIERDFCCWCERPLVGNRDRLLGACVVHRDEELAFRRKIRRGKGL